MSQPAVSSYCSERRPTPRRTAPGDRSADLVHDIVRGTVQDLGPGVTTIEVGDEACRRLDRLDRAWAAAAAGSRLRAARPR